MTQITKCILIILFLLKSDSLISQTNWIVQPVQTNKYLNKVFFVNNNTGWIAGDSGLILKTSDKGQSWTEQNTGTFDNIFNIFFLNERLGWALTWLVIPDSASYTGTILLTTTNGGNNWQKSKFEKSDHYLKTIFFLDSLTGFTSGAPSGMYKTVDGGNRWNLTQIDSNSGFILPLESIKFLNNLTGYACGGVRDFAGTVWKTSNGGSLWKATIVGPEPLNDLYLNNASKVISVGGDFEYGSSYVKTTNTGTNWIYDTLGVFGVARAIDFRTPSEAWISIGDKFCVTKDTGNTFTSFYTTDSIRLNDLCFTDSLNGWAVGYNGAILKYVYSSTGIKNLSDNSNPDKFTLYQNYPNPFNPVTKISYELRIKNYVLLKVYDLLGNEISTLINEQQNEGSYSVNFDGSSLSSGVYFYKLTSGNFEEVKKMLLIK
jgi:photosystem II stability/assembly factor-like uncharacterized protein